MLEKFYNFNESEKKISTLWEKEEYFVYKNISNKKVYSLFLTPPNASGEIHIGNALDIAIQDILARHSRARGLPTVWVPSTDHGGYETQVTFEKKIEKEGKDKPDYSNKELFSEIQKFVQENNSLIKNQISSLGASVDWSRFRYTMDNESIISVNEMFKKMVNDGLIYRNPYMVHYCPLCKTILSDIELKERQEKKALYFIKFFLFDTQEYLTFTTTRPEFIFASTHVLVHKEDKNYASYIGKKFINPITKAEIKIIESKRKYEVGNLNKTISLFSPSYKKYDYEYALRHNIESKNLLDWDGKMIERYPGSTPPEARAKEIEYLKAHDLIEKIDDSYIESNHYCKKGHLVESVIKFTWFLKLDDEKNNLRKRAIERIEKDSLIVLPSWKKKGLVDWLGKMIDWPIARQNVWGIKIPAWWNISDPSKFIVWFVDKEGKKQQGILKSFIDKNISIEEISKNLEKIYTSDTNLWTLDKKEGGVYLEETDTFDTWFSSEPWGTIVFGDKNSKEFDLLYPSQCVVTGQDLLRLFISREILMGPYLTNKLPFRFVYLHPLIKAEDGQKMSKSLGNSVSLEFYLEKFGADVTRMALISYTSEREDFVFENSRLLFFKKFAERLWKIGRIAEIALQNISKSFSPHEFSAIDNNLQLNIERLSKTTGTAIEKYYFESAQKNACDFIFTLENFANEIKTSADYQTSFYVFLNTFKKYLRVLHPFMPFQTEELSLKLFDFSLAKPKEMQ